MNQTEQVLLQAIQKSFWNKDITFPENTDWNAVLKEAEDQTVLGIVISVAPEEYQKEWKGRVSHITAQFVRILHYQEQLCKLLKENDIPMVILKGTAAAIYYPNPSQRTMGDIDYLVPQLYYNTAKEILVESQYLLESDSEDARNIHIHKDNIIFEQHQCFSSEDIRIEEYITNGLSELVIGKVYGSEFPMLPRLANGLVLLGHMAQHLKDGLGLRQVIDWMMYVNCELNDEFWSKEFEKAAEEVGLKQLAVITTRMCQMYLGLSEMIQWCKSADAELSTSLMEEFLSSGNFDRKRGINSVIETVSAGLKRNGFFRQLQISGERNWKAYHKHKWLKPFAWIYQGCRYVRKGIKTKQSCAQIKKDIKQGKQRNELYQRLKIGQPN